VAAITVVLRKNTEGVDILRCLSVVFVVDGDFFPSARITIVEFGGRESVVVVATVAVPDDGMIVAATSAFVDSRLALGVEVSRPVDLGLLGTEASDRCHGECSEKISRV
jgi:hypothetical protein